MGLFAAFIAGIVVGWFLQYLLAPTRTTVQPSASPHQPVPPASEPPKSPAVVIDKLEPLPKEAQPTVAPTADASSTAAVATKPAAPASEGVISGGAASGVALANVSAPSRPAAAEKPVAAPAVQPAPAKASGKSDRFQIINGIGPVYEKKLKESGVLTFADLAQQTPEKVVEIIAPQSWQNIDAAGWIAQAAELAKAE
ncbi:MAG: hypothetical protein KDE47_04220 [Caldilineaceae bacterium]|nr:hypothetical protein [Caldilineaceae bacterium]